MEYVSATLSGILLWLLIFNYLWSTRKNARQQAGVLLFGFKPPPRSTLRKIGLILGIMSPFVFYFIVFVLITNFLADLKSLNYFLLFMQLAQFIMFSTQSINAWLKVLETHQRGMVLHTGYCVVFLPWESIKYCQSGAYYPGVELRVQGAFERSVGVPLPWGCADLVLENLASFVEIRDYSHNVLSQPTRNDDTEGAVAETLRKPRIKHSPFQYDLRTLLLFILVVASFSSWYGILFRRKEETSHQIDKFQKKFEAVECVEYGNGLHSLDFSKCKTPLTDEDMADLAACSQLEFLYFKNDSLTDAGFAHLEKLTNLHYLSISGENTTDDELVHLKKLTNLEDLSLSGKKITNASVKLLKGLKKLQSLSIYGTGIMTEGSNELQKELPQTKIF